MMLKSVFTILPFLLAGTILSTDDCKNAITPGTQIDGPYVFYQGNQLLVNYIFEKDGIKSVRTDSMLLSQKNSTLINAGTDESNISFSIKLKGELQNEKSEYSKVKKLIAISDIEGNFKALRKLLQSNGVIDEQFNWIFGTGHLVLTGDFFDRGSQVTEVLWLIYSLEEKAKAAGGYVHFILGNHEIMNMNGDIRYVNAKYFQTAGLLNMNYLALYNENSELGRWLRTKNVVEKIDHILFAHGGISSLVNNINIPVSKINKLVRPFYADSTYKYKDPKVELLYSDYGPFWYRGYYLGSPKASINQVDSTLSLYDVKHIATGHTIIADTISVLYNGKLLNLDVHHAKGHSEVLLVDDGKFFRVNAAGKKFLIMED